ncbi:MAG: YmdB family metallophosphoesterase, partial [Solirubrobacteraceae bacterium]
VNLSGNLFMRAGRAAFAEADARVHDLEGRCDHILVDMHAEATSEKVGMGWHLDGRVTAVIGTHTHVPTADARVLPGGTAYITDVGMTGPRGGVIGVRRELAVDALVSQMPTKFETSDEDPWLMGVLISASAPGRADAIEPLLLPVPDPG